MTPRISLSLFRSWRLWLLLGSILGLAVVHQLSGVQSSRYHQVLDVVPYLPIMLGALWFGFWGAFSCAVLTATCYLLHLTVQEHGHLLEETFFHRTLNIGMYVVVGLFSGFLAEGQLRAFRKQKELASELERSYAELRERTDQLFESEEQVQRANRLSAVGELAAGLAHEIGNPLSGIKGAAEILADRVPAESEEKRFATLLLNEVRRLDSVVSRFLEGVRSSDGEGQSCSIREVLDSVRSLSRQALEKAEIQLDLELEEGLPAVAADPQQVYQVFLNLLLNAIQATPPGGKIDVRSQRRNGAVECVLEDTGPGIAPGDLPRIFDPFFTRRSGGTGLGLSITHRILAACGGEIRVESKPGEGARFTVVLPLEETAR